jgi:hypothetical protein
MKSTITTTQLKALNWSLQAVVEKEKSVEDQEVDLLGLRTSLSHQS